MKNIDVAAREYAIHMAGSDSYEQNGLEEAFKAGVEFAQQWHSVEDGLPKNGDVILLKDRYGKIKCLELNYIPDVISSLQDRFTYWRYLELK